MLNAGETSQSTNYKALSAEMKKQNSKDDRLKNRKEVINMITDLGCKTIITTPEIFQWLCCEGFGDGFKLDGRKVFRRGKYKNADVYEFYHPSYIGIKKDLIEKL